MITALVNSSPASRCGQHAERSSAMRIARPMPSASAPPTATAPAAVTPGRRGGRPRDPDVDRKVLAAARSLLAQRGVRAFTSDAIAVTAGVGKASIYRRWSNMDELLVDVVRDLGIREVDHATTTRQDLVLLMRAATSGEAARAEIAVLGQVGLSPYLAEAYASGPEARRLAATLMLDSRARDRGEQWPSVWPVLAGISLLQQGLLTNQLHVNNQAIAKVIDDVVLPALRYPSAVPA